MSDYLAVLTTTDSAARAQELAATAVEGRFAACAQIDGPIRSVYQWQGKIENGLIGTQRDPQLIAMPPDYATPADLFIGGG